jgi:hypothetical protein
MVGGDLLQFFEDWYYQHMPMGRARQLIALWRHVWIQWSYRVSRRVKLRLRLWFKARPRPAPQALVKEAIPS